MELEILETLYTNELTLNIPIKAKIDKLNNMFEGTGLVLLDFDVNASMKTSVPIWCLNPHYRMCGRDGRTIYRLSFS